ncbi:MAG: hypothetical protein LBK76_00370 [Verrucomicrobiales bacterium]|jgi:hypothetical protein|nr:hypothetical protein [Verrucomicrobiales bacterium]
MIERAIGPGLARTPGLILPGGDQVSFDMELADAAFVKTLSPSAGGNFCSSGWGIYGTGKVGHNRHFPLTMRVCHASCWRTIPIAKSC